MKPVVNYRDVLMRKAAAAVDEPEVLDWTGYQNRLNRARWHARRAGVVFARKRKR